MDKISRKQALQQGSPRYFTGKPCKHGHVSERLVANCSCCECQRLVQEANGKKYQQNYYSTHKERKLDSNAQWRERNPDYHKEHTRKWREDNLDRSNATIRQWQEDNANFWKMYQREYHHLNRDKILERSKRWRQNNPHKVAEHADRRRTVVKWAKPKWANDDIMRQIYLERDRLIQETGQQYHVDHVIPLNSPVVCGLHCEANLQIVLAEDNLKKGNTHSFS